MENVKKEYCILKDTQYYDNDCQHPQGWSLQIAYVDDDECIGTLNDCCEWLDILTSGNTYLSHGEAGYHYRIVEVLDRDCYYQDWLDQQVDWDECPDHEENSYDQDCAWAENEAYNKDGVLPVAVADSSYMYLVSLAQVEV